MQDIRKESAMEKEALCQGTLDWIPHNTYDYIQNDKLINSLPSTGRWLFDRESFREWKDGGLSNLLWITGKAGSGKSHLAAHTIHNLRESCRTRDPLLPGDQNNELQAIAFVYFSSANMNAKTYSGASVPVMSTLLDSILIQLYAQLPKYKRVEGFRKHHMDSRFDDLQTADIMDGIRSVVRDFTRAYIVVDGLDECSGLPGNDFENMCQFLGSLAIKELANSARVIIFSRPGYPAIRDALLDAVEIQVDDGSNASDIKAFIEEKTVGLAKKPSVLQQNRDWLLYGADGVFLWVSLSIKIIEMETSDRTKLAAAQHMPRGLKQLYIVTLRRILSQPTSRRELALKALLWVTYSQEPLSKKELVHALSLQSGVAELDSDDLVDEKMITSSCGGLLVESQGRYDLLHSSFAEFLKSDAATDVIYANHPRGEEEEPDAILASLCMSYLLLDEFKPGPVDSPEELEHLTERYPLLPHAAKHWGTYLRRSLSPKNIDLACQLLRSLRSRNFAIQALQFYNTHEHSQARFGRPESVQVLHVLSAFGLEDLLCWFPEAITQIDMPDDFSWYPIDYAIDQGHEDMSKWLQSRGRIEKPKPASESSVNTQEGPTSQPLSRHMHLVVEAAKHKWADMMSSAVVAGFDDDDDILFARHSRGDHRLSGALDADWHKVASSGDMETAEALIKSGADPNTRDRFGVTPLMMAARWSNMSMVKRLLACGADVNMQTYDGETALHFLACRVEDNAGAQMIFLLCDRGAGTETRNDAGATPLLEAAERDNAGAVQFLLSKGADLTARNRTQFNVLHSASKNGSSQVLRFLLAGQDPDKMGLQTVAMQNGDHGTSQNESSDGCLGRQSLGSITSLFCADKEGRWPLHHAVASGYIECAEHICDFDSDQVNKKDGDGCTPLYLAVLESQVPLIEFLLDRGADVNAICDSTDYTPLHLAMTGLSLDVSTTLLKKGADPNLENTAGMSAWDIAAIYGDQAIMRFVLDNDPVLREGEDRLQRLLSMAVNHQNFDVVSLLLSPCGQYSLLSNTQLDRDLGLTAIWGGSREIWQMLVSRDSLLAVETDSSGLNALHYAAMFGRTNIIGHISEMDFDHLYETGSHHQPPLLLAAKCGMSGLVKILCDKGANVNHTDSYVRTSMHYAAGLGCRNAVEALLHAGADVRIRDIAGFTAAEYATGTVAALLEGGDEGLQFSSPPFHIEEAREAVRSIIRRLCSPEASDQTAASVHDGDSDLGLIRVFLLKMRMFSEAILVSTSLVKEGLRCCNICGVDIEGPRFHHCAECADVDLCASCHGIFIQGRDQGGPHELEALEHALQPVRRALRDVSQLGINTLLRILDSAGDVLWDYFAEKEERYRRWSKHKYNLEEQQEQQTPGWILVGIVNDLKYLRYYESSTTEASHDMVPMVSGSRERQLTYNFRLLNRDYSPARERPRFACSSHTFLKICSIEELSDDDRAFFDEDGALTKAFWEKLGDNVANMDITQVATDVEHNSGLVPVRSTTEKMYCGEGTSDIVELQLPDTPNLTPAPNGIGRTGHSKETGDRYLGLVVDFKSSSVSGIDVDEVRRNLLQKMRSLQPDDDSLARGEGMVLETAWSLTQAVVYGDETRFPPLVELVNESGNGNGSGKV
ncbi:hypothetical protein PG984_015303 [Apiospora sp. TS-2023a]